ncbi:MAG TPA: hypothetical protein VIN03_09455 [Roseateles sp.]
MTQEFQAPPGADAPTNGRTRIPVGTLISHDHGFYRWPECGNAEDADPKTEFDVSVAGDTVALTAPGFGGAPYRNGSILVKLSHWRQAWGVQSPVPAPEPVAWQVRWTNPGDNPNVSEDETAWKPVDTSLSRGQTMDERLNELRGYRFNGRPSYEVRPLYAAPVQAPAEGDANLTELKMLRARVRAQRDELASYKQQDEWQAKRFGREYEVYRDEVRVAANYTLQEAQNFASELYARGGTVEVFERTRRRISWANKDGYAASVKQAEARAAQPQPKGTSYSTTDGVRCDHCRQVLSAHDGGRTCPPPAPAPEPVNERKQAEHQYSITAFDYVNQPVGSRDWCLYWDGWRARAAIAAPAVQDGLDYRGALKDLVAEFKRVFPIYYYAEPWAHDRNEVLINAELLLSTSKPPVQGSQP